MAITCFYKMEDLDSDVKEFAQGGREVGMQILTAFITSHTFA